MLILTLSRCRTSAFASQRTLPATTRSRMQRVVEKNVLAIWPTGEARKGSAPTVSRKTGMVGYPTFRGSSVFVKTLFNPAVQYGQNITIQSDITPANGTW